MVDIKEIRELTEKADVYKNIRPFQSEIIGLIDSKITENARQGHKYISMYALTLYFESCYCIPRHDFVKYIVDEVLPLYKNSGFNIIVNDSLNLNDITFEINWR